MVEGPRERKNFMRILKGDYSCWTDNARVFITACVVYIAFWNPWLQASMTFSYLDAAVSLVDTGRWGMAHSDLYRHYDTVLVKERVVLVNPPGVVVVVIPFYLAWKSVVAPVSNVEEFRLFHSFLVVVLGAPIMALAVVQVSRLAGLWGATRSGQLWTAALFGLGTPSFFFGTGLWKEGFAALGVVAALRFALEPGNSMRRAAAGAWAAAAVGFAYQVVLVVPLFMLLVWRREGIRSASVFLLGSAPILTALGVYHSWMFGMPWRTGYAVMSANPHLSVDINMVGILLNLLVGSRGGVFLYAPFLVFSIAGLTLLWRSGRKTEVSVAVLFVAGAWLITGAHQSEWGGIMKANTLGHRMIFPSVAVLASFAGPALDRVGHRVRLLVAIPSFVCGYLSAQAGYIAEIEPFPYAIKTWISGTGMGVFFKEALPLWLGLDTLHTVVSRPDVSAEDLLRLLPTPKGFMLIRNQLMFLVFNLAVLSCLAWLLRKLWAGTKERVRQ